MKTDQARQLTRDCEAIQIPWGQKVILPKGTSVQITQALGGSYTISSEKGDFVRIDGKDADALGEEVQTNQELSRSPVAGPADVEKLVWSQLKTIYDPEIPANVVDLGLVYLCQVIPFATGEFAVTINMTLTAPGCGMGDVLKADAIRKIQTIPSVLEVNVNVVMDPPWNQSMMSDAARLQLGMM